VLGQPQVTKSITTRLAAALHDNNNNPDSRASLFYKASAAKNCKTCLSI